MSKIEILFGKASIMAVWQLKETFQARRSAGRPDLHTDDTLTLAKYHNSLPQKVEQYAFNSLALVIQSSLLNQQTTLLAWPMKQC